MLCIVLLASRQPFALSSPLSLCLALPCPALFSAPIPPCSISREASSYNAPVMILPPFSQSGQPWQQPRTRSSCLCTVSLRRFTTTRPDRQRPLHSHNVVTPLSLWAPCPSALHGMHVHHVVRNVGARALPWVGPAQPTGVQGLNHHHHHHHPSLRMVKPSHWGTACAPCITRYARLSPVAPPHPTTKYKCLCW